MHDTITLTGDRLDRIRQALAVAQQQVRDGEAALDTPHLADALAEAEEGLGGIVAAIEAAVDADQAEADETGAAGRARRAWFPAYRAA